MFCHISIETKRRTNIFYSILHFLFLFFSFIRSFYYCFRLSFNLIAFVFLSFLICHFFIVFPFKLSFNVRFSSIFLLFLSVFIYLSLFLTTPSLLLSIYGNYVSYFLYIYSLLLVSTYHFLSFFYLPLYSFILLFCMSVSLLSLSLLLFLCKFTYLVLS